MHLPGRGPVTAGVTGVVVLGAVVLGLPAGPASAGGTSPAPLPRTVTADVLPTWQINGVVWSQVIVGRTVYVTGSFSKARPPGVSLGGRGEIGAGNLFAYDLDTGSRVPSFSHSLNGQGLAIAASPDGRRVYVGGDFTTVDGKAHGHIAAFDTSTNALVDGFDPAASNRVAAITATDSTVYFGGDFGKVDGAWRNHLAAVSSATGTLTNWHPSADDAGVLAMTLTPDHSRVIVGGRFTTLNGTPAIGMGSLNAGTGAVERWDINTKIHNSGANAAITTLSADATTIYGGGDKWMAAGDANFEGTFAADPMTGKIKWVNDCHGDTYNVAPAGQVLYVVSHAHDCRPIGGFPDSPVGHRALAYSTFATGTNKGPDSYGWNYSGVPDSSILTWYPTLTIGSYTGQGQAAWSVAASSDYVVLGGEFPAVNGVRQQGLVRFAASGIAPGKVGPTALAGGPSASTGPGTIKISWRAAWDMDDSPLTYQVWRDDDVMPAAVITQPSSFWNQPWMSFTDSGQPSGTRHSYYVRVLDPDGNERRSGTVWVTATGGSNTLPTAVPTISCAGQTCTFDAARSTDPDGPLTFGWDFGDGTPYLTGTRVSHRYAHAGTYRVRLSARDSRGGTRTVTAQAVTSVDPLGTATRLTVSKAHLVAGGRATVTATVTPYCPGRITIGSAGAVLASLPASSPPAHVTLSSLRAGTLDLHATFKPSDKASCVSSRGHLRVHVAKAASVVHLKVAHKRVRAPHRVKATLTVASPPGVRVTRSVLVYDGSHRLLKVRMHGRSTVRVTLPRLSVGKHRIRAVYGGNAQLTADSSPRVRVVVRRHR